MVSVLIVPYFLLAILNTTFLIHITIWKSFIIISLIIVAYVSVSPPIFVIKLVTVEWWPLNGDWTCFVASFAM